MPAGKTHDRITVWCTPWVCLFARLTTQHWGYTFLVVAGFLFGGLMFGPDLDIWSVQSKRWGWIHWLWRPYRNTVRHRSWVSHGVLAGTVVRLLYLFLWSLLGILIGLEVTNTSGHTSVTWNDLGRSVMRVFADYWRIWVTIAIGIELGAISHSFSDWLVSDWKRQRRQISQSSARRKRRKR